jgi:hypothetical protein
MDKSKMDKLKSMTRKEVCDFVIENTDLFKVCDSCESILSFKTNICPVCSGYRFDEEIKRIKTLARKFKTRPRTSLLDSDFL